MPVTRIKNNQITDLTVNAASKLQDFSITSAKIANNLTYGSDLTISGNLTVQGNVTAIDTQDLVVEDPLILLARDQTGSPTLDIGFIGKRGTEDNIAWVWDESADVFAAVFTDSEITNTTVNITAYASAKFLDVEAANLDITGNIEFSGNITGNVTITGNIDADNVNAVTLVTAAAVDSSGNVDGGNINSAAAVTGVTVTASGNLVGNNAVITNDVGTATVTASGNVSGGNLVTAGDVTTATVTASGNVSGGNLVTAGDVTTATVTASGNVSGGNLVTAGDVTTATVTASGNVSSDTFLGNIDGDTGTFSGNVSAGNISITGTFDVASITASGNITANNLISNNDVTTATVTASGNVSGSNLVTAGDVTTATVTASGNVAGGNLVTAGDVTAATVTASGNVAGGNLVTAGDVTTATVTASGNVSGGNLVTVGLISATGNITGGNLNATTNVTGVTLTASGNVAGNNVVSTNDVTTATVTASGNVSGGNLVTAGDVTTATVTASGNVSGGNLVTAGDVTTATVTASGNVSGGNLVTAGDVTTATVTASGNIDTSTALNANLIAGTSVQIDSIGDIVLNPTGNINASGARVRNMSDPELAFDAATKQYVDDAVSSGIHVHPPVDVETPTALPAATYANGGNTFTVNQTIAGNTVVFTTAANLQVNDQLWFDNSFNGIVGNLAYFVVSTPNTSAAVLTTAYNGVPVSNVTSGSGLSESVRVNSGVGATLTATANAALVIDGFSVSAGNRVLVYNQVNQIQNGVYDVTDAGNVSAPWILTRSSDADTYEPQTSTGLDNGSYFYVEYGDTGAGESYVKTSPTGPFIFGVANIVFTQFSASQVYSANTQAGISLTGTVFSAKVDNDTTAFDGGGNISVKAGANLVTPNIGDATGNSLTLSGNGLLSATTVSATGNVSGGNLTTAGDVTTATVTASGNVSGGNLVTVGLISATGNITGGNLVTAGDVTTVTVTASSTINATGNITGGNLVTAGDVTTATVTASGNVSGGNLVTSGNVDADNGNFTGDVSAANVSITGTFSAASLNATGNITGNNLVSNNDVTTQTVTAAGNVAGGNLTTAGDVTTVTVTASSTIDATGNITGGNLVTAGDVSSATVTASGNVSGGNLITAGQVSATGNVSGGNIVTAGDVTTVTVTASGNVSGGNLVTAGDVTTATVTASGNISANNAVITNDAAANTFTATTLVSTPTVTSTGALSITTTSNGNITLDPNGAGVIILTDETANRMLYTGADKEIATDANATFDGTNLTITGSLQVDNVTINGSDISSDTSELTVNSAGNDVNFRIAGDNAANLLLVDAGTDTVVVGNGDPSVGASFKVDTTDSMMPPVGNTLQRPGTPVVGMLRFSTTQDALELYTAGDGWEVVGTPDFTVITADEFNGDGSTTTFVLSEDSTTAATIVSINGVVQIPTTAYSVTGNSLQFTEAPEASDVIDARLLTTTTTVTAIENAGANAVVAVDNASNVVITGDLIPSANVTYDLGSPTASWNNAYFSGNTIFLGSLQLKEVNADTFAVFKADGTTEADIDVGNIDVSSIVSGTTTIGIAAPNGNAYISVGGVADVLIVTSSSVEVDGAVVATGNVNGGNLATAGVVSATGNVNGGNLITAGLVSLSSITKTGSNGVGNIGSATSAFNTIFAKATSAQYADLAEMYQADQAIAPATVVMFGGEHEVTICSTKGCTRVAGVVSTEPSYLMNSAQGGEFVIAVALTGRVPTRIQGPVRKGDLMVSAGDGSACACAAPAVGSVIGKALEDFDGENGIIEVVVGRL